MNISTVSRTTPKKLWTGIRQILKTTTNPSSNINIYRDGRLITDQKTVADDFNDFFINVGTITIKQCSQNKPML